MLVTQSCLTLCDPMDCIPPGSSVHGILQARILEWVAIPFSGRSSQLRDWTQVSCIASRFFTTEPELGRKEGRALRNWCFQTVVLEKTIESSLDWKDIKLVNPKSNQLWIFIGSTDAEAEALILWPPNEKSWLTGKDADAGKDWGQEERGETEDEMVGWYLWLNGRVWANSKR